MSAASEFDDIVQQFMADMAAVKCSPREYAEALREAAAEMESAAAAADCDAEQEESNDDE